MYAKVGPKSYSTETQAAAGDCCRTGESSGDLPRRRRGRRGGRTQPKARRTQRADEEAIGEKHGALSAESPDVLLSSAADSAGFGPASREAFAGNPSRRSREFEAVPRSLQELMSRIIPAVKSSGTRLAVYLRGWDSLRPWVCGSVSEPPACKPCIQGTTAKTRGVKGTPPPSHGLFPCLPLPEPETSLESRYVNFILGVASYVAVNGHPVPLAAFRRCTSKAHASLIQHIRQQLRDFEEGCGELDPFEVLGSGRSGRLLSDALDRAGATGPVSGLHGSKGFATGARVQDLQPCAIMPLVASRLAFPSVAADWDLAEYLHGDMKRAYLDPALLRVDDPPALPKGKVCGRMSEFTKFAQRADRADGVELFGDDELLRDQDGDGDIIVAGFFSLWKSILTDRTITSRLGHNMLEKRVGASGHLLAHGVLLEDIQLRDDEKARASGKDLPNAYHHGRVSTQRAKTYAVGAAVGSDRFARGPAFLRMVARRKSQGLVPVVPAKVRVSWRSLAMGDLNAVCFMTTAHLNLLRRHGATRELVRYRAPLPRGPLKEGVIVDDYDMVCIVPRTFGPDDPAEDTEAMERADDAYRSVGLTPEQKKTFFARENADFWGATLQGTIGRVRAHQEVTVRTMTLVVALLRQRTVTARVWHAVLGLVVYVSLFARPALAFLDVVFHAADGFAPGVVFVPDRRSRAELATWLAFVPFMSVNLRAKVDTRVFATDASSRTCAAVVTRLPEELCREIWRQRPRRGVGQRYAGDVGVKTNEWADLVAEVESEAEDAAIPPVCWSSDLCGSVGWQPVFQYSLRRSEHIVTKEARPICTLMRRLAAEVRQGGLRVINFADSSANIGAWGKGRSSKPRLGPHLRRVAPDMLLTELQLGVPHVASRANPADAPTRGRAVRRSPLASEPSALAAALLACSFDAVTDDAFAASIAQAKSLAELLEPIAGDPYLSHRG